MDEFDLMVGKLRLLLSGIAAVEGASEGDDNGIEKRKHEYLRFGKRKHEYLRFGKRKHEYLRLVLDKRILSERDKKLFMTAY